MSLDSVSDNTQQSTKETVRDRASAHSFDEVFQDYMNEKSEDSTTFVKDDSSTSDDDNTSSTDDSSQSDEVEVLVFSEIFVDPVVQLVIDESKEESSSTSDPKEEKLEKKDIGGGKSTTPTSTVVVGAPKGVSSTDTADSAEADVSSADAAEKRGDEEIPEPVLKEVGVSKESLSSLSASALLGNESALDLLTDLSKADIDHNQDPLAKILSRIAQTPEGKEALREAILKGYKDDSVKPITDKVIELAKNDPQLTAEIRNLANLTLKPFSSAEEKDRVIASNLLLNLNVPLTATEARSILPYVKTDTASEFFKKVDEMSESEKEAFKKDLSDWMSGKSYSDVDTREEAIAALILIGMPQGSRPEEKGFFLETGKSLRDLDRRSVFDFDGRKKQKEIDEAESKEHWRIFDLAFGRGRSDLKIDDTRYLSSTLTDNEVSTPHTSKQILERWLGGSGISLDNEKLEEIESKYDLKTLAAIDNRIELFNALPPHLREELTGHRTRIDRAQVAAKIIEGTLKADQSDPHSFLLQDTPGETFEDRVEALVEASKDRAEEIEALELDKDVRDTLEALSEFTKKGATFTDRAGEFLWEGLKRKHPELKPLIDKHIKHGIDRYGDKQSNLVDRYALAREILREGNEKYGAEIQIQRDIQFAKSVAHHEELVRSGNVMLADYDALKMVEIYGREAVESRAPHIFKELTRKGGGLERLYNAGLTSSPELVEIDSVTEAEANRRMAHIVKTLGFDHVASSEQRTFKTVLEEKFSSIFERTDVKEALSFLPERIQKEIRDSAKVGIKYLRSVSGFAGVPKEIVDAIDRHYQKSEREAREIARKSRIDTHVYVPEYEKILSTASDIKLRDDGSEYLDTPQRRDSILRALDRDPLVRKSIEATKDVASNMAALKELVKAREEGTVLDDYVSKVKELAGQVDDGLKKLSPDVKRGLKARIKLIDESLKEVKDEETKLQLEKRKEAMQNILDMANNKDLSKFVKDLQGRGMSADTYESWLQEEAPTLLVQVTAAVAASAIAASTFGTGTVISVALIAAAASLSSVAAGQFAREALYQLNHNVGDTGLGSWHDRSYAGQFYDEHEAEIREALNSGDRDKIVELFGEGFDEVVVPLAIEFGTDFAMQMITLGLVKAGSIALNPSALNWLKSPAGIVAREAAENNPTLRSLLLRISRESVKESVEEFGEELAEETAGRALDLIAKDIGGPGMSWLTIPATVIKELLLSRKRSDGKFLFDPSKPYKIDPKKVDITLDALRKDGFNVKKEGSQYKVTRSDGEGGTHSFYIAPRVEESSSTSERTTDSKETDEASVQSKVEENPQERSQVKETKRESDNEKLEMKEEVVSDTDAVDPSLDLPENPLSFRALSKQLERVKDRKEVRRIRLKPEYAQMTTEEIIAHARNAGVKSKLEFDLKYLTTEPEKMVAYKVKGREDLRILISERKAKIHDQVRDLRRQLESTDPARRKAAEETLKEKGWEDEVLPEDVVRNLHKLPDGGRSLKEIIIEDNTAIQDISDAVYLGFSKPQSQVYGDYKRSAERIRIYPRHFTEEGWTFDEFVKHEWSHGLEDMTPELRSAFDTALDLEKDSGKRYKISDYSKTKPEEDWAEHVSKVLMRLDSKTLTDALGKIKGTDSAYKFLVMAKAIESKLGSDSKMHGKENLRARLKLVEDILKPEAVKQLNEKIVQSGRKSDDGIKYRELLRAIGGKEFSAPVVTVKLGGREIELREGQKVSLGRANFSSASREISSKHATIGVDEKGAYVLEDIDSPSTNGTFINGILVTPGVKTYFQPGDEIRFGRKEFIHTQGDDLTATRVIAEESVDLDNSDTVSGPAPKSQAQGKTASSQPRKEKGSESHDRKDDGEVLDSKTDKKSEREIEVKEKFDQSDVSTVLPDDKLSFSQLSKQIERRGIESVRRPHIKTEYRDMSFEELSEHMEKSGIDITDRKAFEAKYVSDEAEGMVAYTVKLEGREDLTIYVSESKNKLHDRVRELRLKAESSDPKVREKAIEDLKKSGLDEEILPEDIVATLDKLPDRGKHLKEFIIEDTIDEGDLWSSYRKGEQGGVLGRYNHKNKRISLYPRLPIAMVKEEKIPGKEEIIKHEWGHHLEYIDFDNIEAFDSALFLEDRLEIEKFSGTRIAERSDKEDWADHIGRVLLDKDPRKLIKVLAEVKGTASAFKFLAMVDSLNRTLKKDYGKFKGAENLQERIKLVEEILKPDAIKQLKEILSESSEHPDLKSDAKVVLDLIERHEDESSRGDKPHRATSEEPVESRAVVSQVDDTTSTTYENLDDIDSNTLAKRLLAKHGKYSNSQLQAVLKRATQLEKSYKDYPGLDMSSNDAVFVAVIEQYEGKQVSSDIERQIISEKVRRLKALVTVAPGQDIGKLIEATKSNESTLDALIKLAKEEDSIKSRKLVKNLEAWRKLLDDASKSTPDLKMKSEQAGLSLLDMVSTGNLSRHLAHVLTKDAVSKLSSKERAQIFSTLLKGADVGDKPSREFAKERLKELNDNDKNYLLTHEVVSEFDHTDIDNLVKFTKGEFKAETDKNPELKKYVEEIIGLADLYKDEAPYVSAALLSRLFRRSQNYDNSKFDGKLYRRDNNFERKTNGKGLKKSYIDIDESLKPAGDGNYSADELRSWDNLSERIVIHIDARAQGKAKENSPFTSFFQFPRSSKYGDSSISIDLEGLRAAIKAGDVKDVRVIELPEVIEAIRSSDLSATKKKMALDFVLSDDEVLILGTIPKEFIERVEN